MPSLVDSAHQRDRLLQFGRGQARERFVEQHQPRTGREHAGDLEPLASGRAERTGALRALVAQARSVRRSAARVFARVAAMVMAQKRADHHVLEHGHVLERRRHLEGAADAGACVRLRPRRGSRRCRRTAMRPVVGTVSPARQLKKVDLPAPFGPIRPMISPSSTARSAPRTAQEAAERLGDVLCAKQHASASSGAAPRAATSRACRRARSARSRR